MPEAVCVVSGVAVEASTVGLLARRLLDEGAPDSLLMIVMVNCGLRAGGKKSGIAMASVGKFASDEDVIIDDEVRWRDRFRWMSNFGIGYGVGMLSNQKPQKQKKPARGAWRDPSAIDIVKRNTLDQLQSTTEIFESRWGFEKLRQIDEDLYEALADQRDMLTEACGPMGQLAECTLHGHAMQRGWARANAVMEAAEVGSVVALFPGAMVVAVRHKEDNPFAAAGPDEPPSPFDGDPTMTDPPDDEAEAENA